FGYGTNGLISQVFNSLALEEISFGNIPDDTSLSDPASATLITYDGSSRVKDVTSPEPAPSTTPNPTSRTLHTYGYTTTGTGTVKSRFPGAADPGRKIRTVTYDTQTTQLIVDQDAANDATW